MERALTPDEKLRRAEEIYYRKRSINVRQNQKTVSVPVSNKKYMIKKMVIKIIICLIIYCTYYAIKNFNFIFSKDVMDKTNAVLSYDINFQELYCKVANYINNFEYFNNKEEAPVEENKKNEEIQQNSADTNVEEKAQEEKPQEEAKVETLLATDTGTQEVKDEENSVNQMQQDAEAVKQNYSLINPLEGQITSRFGVRNATEEVISPYHVGLDIAANAGTIFVSSMAGEVVYSGDLSGYGNCIQIQKDDILTIYGHCNKLYVNKGDVISQGQQIGEVGATGNATGPHLHFEIRKSGRYVDPELVL